MSAFTVRSFGVKNRIVSSISPIRLNPGDRLRNYHGPVQFLIAGAYEVIGTETGRSLAAQCAWPKSVQIVPAAGYNDLAEQSPQWWRGVMNFWDEQGQ